MPAEFRQSLTRRMALLLTHLDDDEYRSAPIGVGQKTVNQATALGFIKSKQSRPDKLPDRHRLTKSGRAALDAR